MLFFLLLAMVLAASFLGGKGRLRAVATFLVIYGAGLALFSIIQHFAWNGNFYWFRPNTQSVSPFGPFANHNHFAGHMEMLALIPLGLLAGKAIPRDRRLLYGYAAALMGVAVVMSLSRAGMIALCASILFVALWGLSASEHEAKPTERKHSSRPILSGRLGAVVKGVGAVACVVLAIALGIAWTGADPVINRVVGSTDSAAQESFYSSRGWIWSDTITLISANPITGVGLGAYETAYPVYSKSDGTLLVNYAHNDYLQILADGGIIGGALAVWLLVLLWRSLRQGAKSRDTLVRGLSLGFGASLFAILVHSIFDFNLQIPANTFLFLMISTLVTCLPVQAKAPVEQPAVQKISLAARAAR
jgi:O-antigen ligase